MKDSIVVYRLRSANDYKSDENLSFQTMMTLRNMDIVKPCEDPVEVIREGVTTVTVYFYERY